MRQLLPRAGIGVVAAVLCLPPAAMAQRAENLSEEVLSKLNDLQTMAGQLAKQSGQFAGRTVGPQLADATGQLTQILTNFDIWACGSAVTALGIKHRQLAVAAARAMPADPQLDRAVVDLGNLIAQLQELCNRYVYDAGQRPASGANTAQGGTPVTPAPEPPPAPARSAQETICYNRCHDLYLAFLNAEREYADARRTAERIRAGAEARRKAADEAAARARESDRRSEEIRRERERLQRIISDPKSTSAERLAAAEAYGKIRPLPPGTGPAADDPHRTAAVARAEAADWEASAARAERRASMVYDALIEIYRAWERCARDCAQQARLYDQTDVDPHRVFTGMPLEPPARPPFYRPPASQPQQTPTPPRQTSARLVATPIALTGGLLVGAVHDGDGEPRENQRIAVTQSTGSRAEISSGADGRFVVAMPRDAGKVALMIPESAVPPIELEVVDAVPAGLPGRIPDLIELDASTTVGAPYRSITATNAKGLAIELPASASIGAGRTTGITSFRMPGTLGTGRVMMRAVGLDGRETAAEAVAYAYVKAWIDRDNLFSGQNAEFGYELDFGTGPMTVVAIVTIEGPIVYERAGRAQVLRVDNKGRTRLTGKLRALKGSPAGIPFKITATFSRQR